MMKKTMVSWSSGKDSCWMLANLLADKNFEIIGLFTSINEPADRIAMHAVRVDLLKSQAASIGLDLRLIPLPDPCSNDDYERIMSGFVQQCRQDGVECIAFGDLYLEDIRSYRETQMRHTGIKAIFPIWLENTHTLSKVIIQQGYKAIITCIDLKKLDRNFLGREYDEQLIADLPAGVDPCGENGEFHSFVYDGPVFSHCIPFAKGATFEKDGFLYQDLIPS